MDLSLNVEWMGQIIPLYSVSSDSDLKVGSVLIEFRVKDA